MCSKQPNTETNTDIVTDTTSETIETDLDVIERSSLSKCLNCGTELQGTYCHNCGQHVTDHEMTVKSFIFDYLDNAFLWDSRHIDTIKRLITKPGVLTKEYISGKFVSQVQPLKLNMFLLFVFITLFVFFGSDKKMSNSIDYVMSDERIYDMMKMDAIVGDVAFMERIATSPRDTVTMHTTLLISEKYSGIIDSLRVIYNTQGEGIDRWVAVVPRVLIEEKVIVPNADGYYHFDHSHGTVEQEMVMFKAVCEQSLQLAINYFPMIILLTVPILAISLRLVERKKLRPYYDRFIFSMHYIAFVELTLILIYIINLVAGVPFEILNTLLIVISCTYLAISFREVYETTWMRSITRAILSSLIYYSICMLMFLILVVVAIFMAVLRDDFNFLG